ncbi:MAG: Wzz/FepE/Etk N-terminal domain-containing protein, partial [Thermoanaerobaculia bacterium]
MNPAPGAPQLPNRQADFAEPESEFHLADYLRVATERWTLIALVTIAVLGLSLLQFAVTPKEYRAATMIQIERKVSLPLKAVQDSWMDNWFNLEYYPTQYRLLTSRGLAERVVLDLGLQADPEFNPGAAAR